MNNREFAKNLAWAVAKDKIKTVTASTKTGKKVEEFISKYADGKAKEFDPSSVDVENPTPEISSLASAYASVKKENPHLLDLFSRIRQAAPKKAAPVKDKGFHGPEW